MDDGSQLRHTSVAFVMACIFSLIAPVVGYFATVSLAVWYEKGRTDSDSLADIRYGRQGALFGSVLGSGLGLMIWYYIIFGKF